MAFSVNHVETREDTNLYQVLFPPPHQPVNVTVTADTDVAAAWVSMFQPEHGSFFPTGVAVHVDEGGQNAHVLTISSGQECLVFQLYRGHLNRDVMVFLRDVCTCYGWKIDAYDDLLVRRHPLLSLGRLTDIQTLVPNGQNMGLGDFGMVAFGRRVAEPTTNNWTGRRRGMYKSNQIRETVLEAYICQVLGKNDPNPPPNNSLVRVISNQFPHIHPVDNMIFEVSINAYQTLRVTFSDRPLVLITWLKGLGTRPTLIGFDVKKQFRGDKALMGLACENECLVYKFDGDQKDRQLAALEKVFEVYLNSSCPFVSWNIGGYYFEHLDHLGIKPERLLDVKTEFPRTHSYYDLARMILGYEMPIPTYFLQSPKKEDVMAVAVEAYVCLMGGCRLGYENRQWW